MEIEGIEPSAGWLQAILAPIGMYPQKMRGALRKRFMRRNIDYREVNLQGNFLRRGILWATSNSPHSSYGTIFNLYPM